MLTQPDSPVIQGWPRDTRNPGSQGGSSCQRPGCETHVRVTNATASSLKPPRGWPALFLCLLRSQTCSFMYFGHSFHKPIKNTHYKPKYWLSTNDAKKNKMWPMSSNASFWEEPVILLNIWPQEKSGAKGTQTRGFPRQTRKIGNVSDNTTLELVMHQNKTDIKVLVQEIGSSWFC